MSAGTTILALLFYPLIFNLPLNFVRFRWGFSHGAVPMPQEVEERAEAADRLIRFFTSLTLLVVTAFLLRDSSLSLYAVGLTTRNWKSAVALGAILSCVPLAFATTHLRALPPDKLREHPEARGPLAEWFGLSLLGFVSNEFWRAFCIAGFLHLGLTAWAAVLVTAAAYGATQLTQSTARAVGAATFGAITGFLFVTTGSLLAPLTTSLIAGEVYLYALRRLSSSQGQTESSHGYVSCPVCGTSFEPAKARRTTIRSFNCPVCDEELAYATEENFGTVLFFVSLCGSPLLFYFLGLRDLNLIFASVGGVILFFFTGSMILTSLSPPKNVRLFHDGLRLTDWHSARKKDDPRQDNRN